MFVSSIVGTPTDFSGISLYDQAYQEALNKAMPDLFHIHAGIYGGLGEQTHDSLVAATGHGM